jgi:hypothetical protein
MHSSFPFSLFTSAEITALATAVFAFLWKRQISRWPFLFSALALEMAIDLICLHLMGPHHYRQYFFTFWWGQVAQAFLKIGIIADVFRSFPGLDFLPKRVYLFITVAALVMGILAGAYCYHISPDVGARIQNLALLMNRCVNISFGAFAMVILFTFKAFNFGWDPSGARISSVFFLRICCGVVVAEIISSVSAQDPRAIVLRTAANYLDSACSIVAFSFWSFLVFRNKPIPLPSVTGDASAHVANVKTLLSDSFSRER